MNRRTSGSGPSSLAITMPFEELATQPTDDDIQLDSCPVFERIVVTTRRSVYDIIVLSGDAGEVMIRGGRFFPEFRRARVAGSTAGGSALKLRSICAGLSMELNANGKRFVTSRIQAISDRGLRRPPDDWTRHESVSPKVCRPVVAQSSPLTTVPTQQDEGVRAGSDERRGWPMISGTRQPECRRAPRTAHASPSARRECPPPRGARRP